MKKIVMALAIVGVAIGAQAGRVNWNSGYIQGATSAENGALSGETLTAYTVNAILWQSTSALGSWSAGDLYAAYKDGTTGELFAGVTPVTSSTSSGSVQLTDGATYNNGTSIYGAVLYTYEDAAGNVYYIENSWNGTAASGPRNISNLALVQGGGASGTATSWTVIPAATPDPGPSGVPEPTSGLLLLVGGAMLALRRKRA